MNAPFRHYESATELLAHLSRTQKTGPATPVVFIPTKPSPAEEALQIAGRQVQELRAELEVVRKQLSRAKSDRGNYRRYCRELESAIGGKVNDAIAAKVREAYGPDLGEMIAAIYSVTQVTMDEIKSARTVKRIVKARHILVWLIRSAGMFSLAELGSLLSRDHSSAVYATAVCSLVAEKAGVSYAGGKDDLVALVRALWEGDWVASRSETVKNIRKRADWNAKRRARA